VLKKNLKKEGGGWIIEGEGGEVRRKKRKRVGEERLGRIVFEKGWNTSKAYLSILFSLTSPLPHLHHLLQVCILLNLPPFLF
jgi:hypothetical protein